MIQTSDSGQLYVGNNSTVTPYPIPFLFHHNEDLVVTKRDNATNAETPMVLSTDYIVTGAGNPGGGDLTTVVALPNTFSLSIVRTVPFTQLTSYEEGDSFPAKSHEAALDKLTMEVQQLARGMGTGTGDAEDIGTAFRVTEASGGINAVVKKIDTMLGVDAMGAPILRTAEEMLAWLGTVATVWQDDGERAGTRGAFQGQLGVQIDNSTIYVAQSTEPGAWLPYFIGTGVVYSENGTPVVHEAPDGELVGTTDAQVLSNKTINSSTINSPSGLHPEDVQLGNVDNTSDTNKPISFATQVALDAKQNLSQKAIANGYPSLDSSGKIPVAQIPDALVGASQYQGTWNASTNSPAIPAAAIGNKGWYYQVAVAGTTSINGINSWAVGDTIISSGMVWQKIPNYSAVVSVNTRTGAVVINKTDVGLSNVDNTSDATKNSAIATLTNKTIDGAANTLTVRLGSDVTGNLPVSRLNNGTGAGGSTWWCGDGSWKAPPGGGDVAGQALSVDGEVTLFSGTTGKAIKRATGTGLVNVTSGVYQAPVPLSSLSLVPAGCVMDYMGPTEPAGWLFCDGRPVSQATYATLYGLLGVNYVLTPPVLVNEKGLAFITTDAPPFTLPAVTVSGTDRLLIVWVIAYNGPALPTVATVKFGGVNLTKLSEATFYGPGGAVQLWYLKNPAVSTANVVVTSDVSEYSTILAQVYNGVNQTTTFGTPASSASYAAGVSNGLLLDSSPGDLLIDALTFYTTTDYHSCSAGQTEVSAVYSPSGYFGLRSSNKVKTYFKDVPTYDTDTVGHMGWGYQTAELSTLLGVALKPVGVAAGMFYLPDLRGRVIAGRENMGGISAGRMPSFTFYANALGTVPSYEYLYNITYHLSYEEGAKGYHRLCKGMQITGPGLQPNTFFVGWNSPGIAVISKHTTTLVTGGKYTAFWADTTVLGSTLGHDQHTLTKYELASHSHPWFGATGAGGGSFPTGSGWGYTTNNTYSEGWDSPHNNLQPSFIANKIIKY